MDWIVSTQNSCCEALTPSCVCMWRRGLQEIFQIKWSNDVCLQRRGKRHEHSLISVCLSLFSLCTSFLSLSLSWLSFSLCLSVSLSLPLPLWHVHTQWEGDCLQARKRATHTTGPYHHFGLDSQPPGVWESKIVIMAADPLVTLLT